MAPPVFKTDGRAMRGGRFDSCLFRTMDTNERFASIPQVDRLLQLPAVREYFPLVSRALAVKAVSAALASERAKARKDESYRPDAESCAKAALRTLARLARRRHQRVLNGTGIVLHTNLGRSPIPGEAWDGARDACTGYAPVELRLEDGTRGGRGGLVHELAAELAGAEAALAVNNNAAAVLLALTALASGREVIVARGEQVQIGGGFRVPDILELAGARFREVGTTNIVEAGDYARAVGPDTACVLIVHTSNFALRGFARKPRPQEIVAAVPAGIPVIVDQGSGCHSEDLPGETPVRSFVEAGCALVCFSGDKLLGGPQAGIIAGRADLVAALAGHPLYRAFRPGKATYALLERVLVRRLDGGDGPAGAALVRPADELRKLARRIRARLPKDSAELVDSQAACGGGTGPDENFPSTALDLSSDAGAETILALLRRAPTPLVAIIRDGRVRVDMAALTGEDPAVVAGSISWALEQGASLLRSAARAAARSAAKPTRDLPSP